LIYLDSSALVTLISGRAVGHAGDLRQFLAGKPGRPMASSTVGFIETVHTLDQIGEFPTVMADLVRDFTEILLTEEVRDAAARLPSGVRTLDAVHLASAQIIGESLEVLVTYDKRMLEIARTLGIPSQAPGLH
jgi:uncharacterized protein